MINLLPPDIKENYRYARRNSRLAGWAVAFSIAIIGLAGLSVGGIIYLQQAAGEHTKQADDMQATLKKQNQAVTKLEVKEIDNNLKLAVQVLSKQVLYSKLLKQMATIVPDKAALTDLSISQVQGAMDIKALTADYNAATQLQINLADAKNRIFSKADIISINCTSATGIDVAAKQYPCDVTVRALFADNNPFLFISNGGKPASAASKTPAVTPATTTPTTTTPAPTTATPATPATISGQGASQ